MPSPDPVPRAPAVVLGPPFHPCRLGPVVRQVGEYLAGADAPAAEQRHAAAHAFRNAQSDFEQFTASVHEGNAMVSMELRINGGGRELVSVYSHLPSPLTLLLVCTRNCEAGDLVGVRQVTAKCGSMTQEAHWPFGLAEAERLTRPVSVVFAELQDAGPASVRRRERVIVKRRVVTERRREQTRRIAPRLRRWREEQVRGIEVCVGVRAYRLGRVSEPTD